MTGQSGGKLCGQGFKMAAVCGRGEGFLVMVVRLREEEEEGGGGGLICQTVFIMISTCLLINTSYRTMSAHCQTELVLPSLRLCSHKNLTREWIPASTVKYKCDLTDLKYV